MQADKTCPSQADLILQFDCRNEKRRKSGGKSDRDWIARSFNARECKRFVPKIDKSEKQEQMVCQCGNLITDHDCLPSTVDNTSPWNPDDDSREFPTNAYGFINFGRRERPARFIRVSHTTDESKLANLIFGHWKVKAPGVIISVCGGMAEIKIEPVFAQKLRNAITKFAYSSGAWITTSGIRSGVAREIGKAVKCLPNSEADPITCIAVASWSVLLDKNDLINDGKETAFYNVPINYKEEHKRLRRMKIGGAYLDPYHTHYILVDNGTSHEYAVEIPLRARLEAYIATCCKAKTDATVTAPICCLFMGGSPSALQNLIGHIQNRTPIIVVKGSGRVADVLAEAYEYLPNKEQDPQGYVARALCEEHKSRLIELSDPESSEEVLSTEFQWFEECLQNSDLITVIDQRCDLDCAILNSLMRANKNLKAQLQLSVFWNCIEEAHCILDAAYKTENAKLALFSHVAISAVMYNRVEFVVLFHDRGLKPQKYLTIESLHSLYQAIPDDHSVLKLLKLKKSESYGLKEIGILLDGLLGGKAGHQYSIDQQFDTRQENNCDSSIDLDAVIRNSMAKPSPQKQSEEATNTTTTSTTNNVINNNDNNNSNVANDANQRMPISRSSKSHLLLPLLENSEIEAFPDGRIGANSIISTKETEKLEKPAQQTIRIFQDPAFDLFIYAVLLNWLEMSMVFFQKVREPLGAALAAAAIQKNIAKHVTDKDEKLAYQKSSTHFEGIAYDLLNLLRASNQQAAQDVLVRPISCLSNRTSLELAREAKLVYFISNESVRAYLESAWYGKLSGAATKTRSLLIFTACLFPPLLYLLKYDDKNVEATLSNSRDRDRKPQFMEFYPNSILVGVPMPVQTPTSITSSTFAREISAISGTSSILENTIASATGLDNSEGHFLFKPRHSSDDLNDAKLGIRRKAPHSRIQSKTKIESSKIKSFFSAPCVVFIYSIVAYVAFLVGISYDYLIIYNCYDHAQRNLLTNWLELFLISFVASYFIGEIHQIISSHAGSIRFKLNMYVNDKWNQLDTVAVLFFVAALIFGNIRVDEQYLEAIRTIGRVFYACSILAFFLKFLHFYTIFALFGPNVLIVGGMLKELIAFLAILLLFVISWGVAQYGLLFPANTARWSLVQDVLSLSWWQMFTNFYLNVIQQPPYDVTHDDCTNDEDLYLNFTLPRCPDKTGQWIVPILLGVYIVITNVLLLSLLIAIFNQVIESREEVYQHWSFQRFELLLEFSKNAPIVPPFTIIYYTFCAVRKLCRGIPKHEVSMWLVPRLSDRKNRPSIYSNSVDMGKFGPQKKRVSVMRNTDVVRFGGMLVERMIVVRDEYMAKKKADEAASISKLAISALAQPINPSPVKINLHASSDVFPDNLLNVKSQRVFSRQTSAIVPSFKF